MILLDHTVSHRVESMISLDQKTKLLAGSMISQDPIPMNKCLPGATIPADPDTNCNKPFARLIKHGLDNFLRLIVQLNCLGYQKVEEKSVTLSCFSLKIAIR